ncbi:MAG: 5'-methylthioadenosine/adenosylhomocysteine nucleosidase [Eubacteriales bacterium]
MKVGIIGAMEKEIALLKEGMIIKDTKEVASLMFYKGELEGHDVIIVKSGIGKVNAAMCTQILIDQFQVSMVINTGVAGALHHDLEIGDIVVSTDTMQHDIDASIFGDPKGTIPGMPISIFNADEKLLAVIDEILKENKYKNIYKGRILTGDQAIGNNEIKKELYQGFKGYCVEMEGGAIAHVCHLNGIPFLIIRAISDKADEEVEMNYMQFLEMAAKKSSDLLKNILSKVTNVIS